MKAAYIAPDGGLIGWSLPRLRDGMAKVELAEAASGGLDIVLSTWVDDETADKGGWWNHFGAAPIEEPWPWWVNELPGDVLAWLKEESK